MLAIARRRFQPIARPDCRSTAPTRAIAIMNGWHCAYVVATNIHTRARNKTEAWQKFHFTRGRVVLLGAKTRGHAMKYRRADQHKMLAWRSTMDDGALEKCVHACVRAFDRACHPRNDLILERGRLAAAQHKVMITNRVWQI